MKILFLGDLHIGARNSSKLFMDYFHKYYTEELFPYILANKVDLVIQLGDTLDKRKSIDFLVSRFLENVFYKFFEDNQIPIYSVLGNHDIYYRQTTEVSGLSVYEDLFKMVHIISEPSILEFSNIYIRLIPWLCDSNRAEIEKALKEDSKIKNKYKILAGHLELAGFPIHKGINSESGSIEVSSLSQYDKVYSGHYHSPSDKGNISYIGIPYQLTWSDHGDEKKVVCLDTETMEYEIVPTQLKMFHKFFYTNELSKLIDYSSIRKSYIKIILNDKDISNARFDIFLSELEEKAEPIQIQIIDNREVETNSESFDIEVDDPITILIKTLESTIEDKEILDLAKSLSFEIYNTTLATTEA